MTQPAAKRVERVDAFRGVARFGACFWLFLDRANAWLARFRMGPAEWAWRCLTYGRLQPFKGAA